MGPSDDTPSGGGNQIRIETAANDASLGTVSGAASYDKGETVTLKATANKGYRFLQWTDDVLDNPREVTADEDSVTYTLFRHAELVSASVMVGFLDPETSSG